MEIKEGEIFGFIGPNGAGKSTTVRTLLNFIFPTSGTAEIMGLDIVKDTVKIKNNVGYIPAEINFYEDMKVIDFLTYSTKFHLQEFQERLDYLVDQLKLDLDRKIEDLSFGNKKKVAIVAALLYEPKIYIFDEPTSGLDPLMQKIFFDLLKEEKKRGATIFYSSHVLSEVQKICDRVGIIKEGRLIKIESIEKITLTRAKNCRIIGKELDLKKLSGVKELRSEGDLHTFIFTDEINKLLNFIKDKNIIDINISEPTLEEIFMHYYS